MNLPTMLPPLGSALPPEGAVPPAVGAGFAARLLACLDPTVGGAGALPQPDAAALPVGTAALPAGTAVTTLPALLALPEGMVPEGTQTPEAQVEGAEPVPSDASEPAPRADDGQGTGTDHASVAAGVVALPTATGLVPGTPEHAAGTPEQAAGTPEQVAGTLEHAAGTPEHAAGTPAASAGQPAGAETVPAVPDHARARSAASPAADAGQPQPAPAAAADVPPAQPITPATPATTVAPDAAATAAATAAVPTPPQVARASDGTAPSAEVARATPPTADGAARSRQAATPVTAARRQDPAAVDGEAQAASVAMPADAQVAGAVPQDAAAAAQPVHDRAAVQAPHAPAPAADAMAVPDDAAAPGAQAPAHEAGRSDTPAPATPAARIVELVERLRAEPPPRQVVIDLEQFGVGKLVVSLRADTVVVEPLDAGASLDPRWSEDLDAALAERGWSFDRDERADRDQQHTPASADIPAGAGDARRVRAPRGDDGQLRL